MSSERVFNYIKLLLNILPHTTKKAVLVDYKGKPFGDVWQEIVKLVQAPNLLNYINAQNPNEAPYVIHELVGIEATPEIKEFLCTKFECPEEIEIKEESLNDEIDLEINFDDEPITIPSTVSEPPREKPFMAKEDEEDIELILGSDDDIINPEANDAVIDDLAQLAETTKVEIRPAPAVSKPKAKTSKPVAPRAQKTWETSLVGDVHEANLPTFDELGYKPEWIKIIDEVKSSLNELLTLKINFFAVGIDPLSSKYKSIKFEDSAPGASSDSAMNIIYQTDIHVMQFKSSSIQIIYVYKFRDTVGKAETMRENYVESSLIKYGPKLLEKVTKEELTAHPVELKIMKAISEYTKIAKELKDHINALTEVEDGLTSTGKPKHIFTFKCKPGIISSDLIYNFKEMNVSGIDLVSSKEDFIILGNDY